MNKHTLANTIIRRAYLDGMAEGVGRGALGYAWDMAGEYASANAEPLLDAAPDLLAALEWCAEWIDANAESSDTGEGQQADAVLSSARATIAKAKGGADA